MSRDLAAIAADGHGAPSPAISRGTVQKEHPATIAVAHFQAVPFLAHEGDRIPGDDRQAFFHRIGPVPEDAVRAAVQSGHRNRESGSVVDPVDILSAGFTIQNERTHRVVNRLTKEEGLFVILPGTG